MFQDICVISTSSGQNFSSRFNSALEKLVQEGESFCSIPSHNIVFANTEQLSVIDETVNGRDVIIIADPDNHSCGRSTDQNLKELTQMMAAAKIAGAERIDPIVTNFPYARQDIPRGRQGISAADAAREIEEAAQPLTRRVYTIDVHNRATAGFFRQAVLINLYASKVFIPFITENLETENMVVYSPDLRGIERAKYYAQKLGCGFGAVYKVRDYSVPNHTEVLGLVGAPVLGRDVLFVDDMGDTLSSYIGGSYAVLDSNARTVSGMFTHGLFNNKILKTGGLWDPLAQLQKLYEQKVLGGVYVADTAWNRRDELASLPFITDISVASLFAEAIYLSNNRRSISHLLE